MGESNSYIILIEKFIEHDAVSASNIIESLKEDEAIEVFEELNPATSAKIIRNLQVTYAASLIEKMSDEVLSKTLSLIEPQLLTSILMFLAPGS
ncbi:MAG: hypothetical protein HUK40_24435, partial [Desulfobacter sp.]|nr:hypothetical protein [Desulfobacter sp.]